MYTFYVLCWQNIPVFCALFLIFANWQQSFVSHFVNKTYYFSLICQYFSEIGPPFFIMLTFFCMSITQLSECSNYLYAVFSSIKICSFFIEFFRTNCNFSLLKNEINFLFAKNFHRVFSSTAFLQKT